MRITISDVVTAHDALLASGLALWISDLGITVEAPPTSLQLMIQPVSRTAAAVAVDALLNVPAPSTSGEAGRGQSEQVAATVAATAAPGERKKPGRKPAKADTKPVSPAAAPVTDGPRITNADRIAAYLKAGPATSTAIGQAIKLETSQVSNLLWNMERASRVKKDASSMPYLWSLA